MVDVILIAIRRPRADEPAMPRALLNIGGIPLLERQLRLAKKAGIERALILCEGFDAELSEAMPKMRRVPGETDLVTAPIDAARRLEARDQVLIVDDALLIDRRLFDILSTDPAEVVLLAAPTAPSNDEAVSLTHGGDVAFGGLAKLPGELVISRASRADAADFYVSLIEQAGAADDASWIDIDAVDRYVPDRRRRVPVLWLPIADEESAKQGTDALIAAAQKGCLDWPARWLHPPIENALTRALLPTAITPNMVTLATALVGFLVTYLFAVGELGWGLIGALVVGPLDGIDGKLARTRIETSRLGELEHVLDKLVEYSWYVAIAYHLAGQGFGEGAYLLAAITIAFALAEVATSEFYRHMTGRQLDDAGRVERAIRLISGRRNTFMWALVPFALLESWYLGFAMIAAYSTITFFVALWRFFVRTRDYTSSVSPVVAKNFRDAAYFPVRRTEKG